jgi:hypothetical protein
MLQSFASASSLDPELEKLINSIIGKKELSLATEGCHIQKEKWALILLTKQVFVEDIKFKDKCDIEGKFTVKADQFFPISLKLRKLNHYHLFNAKIKFEVTFTDQAVLKLELIQASLTGKKSIYFKLDYAVIIDPLNPESMIKKHLGGNLVITSKDYKKEIKSYKLKSDKLK